MIQCTCMHACTLKHCVCFKNCDDHMMHVWSCGMPNICVFQELWWSHDAPRMCTSGVVECQTSVCFKNFDDHMTLQGYACLELWNAKQLCVSRTVMITWCSEDMYAHLELWIAKGVCVSRTVMTTWPAEEMSRVGECWRGVRVSPNLVITQKNLVITCMYMHARWELH